MTIRAPAAVFVHGTGQDQEIWSDVLPLVPRPAYAHELPGHGGRFGPPLTDLAAMADDLAAHVPSVPAVLVGHSLGGAIVRLCVERRPAVAAGVVLVCTSPAHVPDRRVQDAVAAGDLERFVGFARAGVTGITGHATPDLVRSADRLERLVRRNRMRAVAADYAALASVADLLGDPRPLSVPTVILAGERDALVSRRRATALADAMGGQLRVIAGASHQLPWDAPIAVADAVRDVRAWSQGVAETAGTGRSG